MSSIFTQIINGEIPCHKVHESDEFLALLDIMPLREGHVLVVPKKEVDYIFDIEDDLLSQMMLFAKEVAGKIRRAIPCNRIGVSVIGLEVPHAHIHLIPLDRMTDMDFTKEKLKLDQEQLAAIATKIAFA